MSADVRRCLFIMLGLALCAHAAFSWIGFNPANEGFTLSTARRLLDGQVPHRDFIAIRPVGSALLYLPLLRMAGDGVIWWSRLLAWIEWALQGLCWAVAISRLLDLRRDSRRLWMLAVLAFAWGWCGDHRPMTVKETTDALLFSALGIALATGARGRTFGYLVLGMAPLCKQNFALLALLVIFILGDYRRWRCWVAALTPSLVYVLAMVALGAFPDFAEQVLGRVHEVSTYTAFGSVRSHNSWWVVWRWELACFLGSWLGTLLTWYGLRARPDGLRWSLHCTVGYVALLALYVIHNPDVWRETVSFSPLGVAFALGCVALLDGGWGPLARACLLALAVSSVTAMSLGERSPCLSTGLLCVFLIGVAAHFAGQRAGETFLLPALVCLTLVMGVTTALLDPYCQPPADSLTRPLQAVFPGAAGLYTDDPTADMLIDMRLAMSRIDTPRYSLLPDMTAWWIRSPQPDPLPIDSVISSETPTNALTRRVRLALEAGRADTTYILCKWSPDVISYGERAYDARDYPVVGYLRTHLRKVAETRYFELYR